MSVWGGDGFFFSLTAKCASVMIQRLFLGAYRLDMSKWLVVMRIVVVVFSSFLLPWFRLLSLLIMQAELFLINQWLLAVCYFVTMGWMRMCVHALRGRCM